MVDGHAPSWALLRDAICEVHHKKGEDSYVSVNSLVDLVLSCIGTSSHSSRTGKIIQPVQESVV